VSLNYTPET